MHAENLGRILLDKTRNSGAKNYGILIRFSADWMGKVDYESEIFLIQRYITLWKGTTASVDIISLSSKLFHDSCFKPAERRKYFFRYSVNVGKNSFDLKQVAIISAETCQMVLNLILAGICIEKNWGDEKILVIPVTWQISAQPLPLALCLALSGSIWLSQALSGSLRLSLALQICLQSPCLAHKALARLVALLLRYSTFSPGISKCFK